MIQKLLLIELFGTIMIWKDENQQIMTNNRLPNLNEDMIWIAREVKT